MKVNLRSIDLNLLTVFDTLVKEQHLSRAAEKLNMSQPAVSNALQRLRVLLNDELFVRTAKGMQPTSRARTLRDPIHQALNIIQSNLSLNDEFDFRTEEHQFSIAMNDYGECVLVPEIISSLRKTAPLIGIHILPDDASKMPEQLRDGELDIAFDYLPIKGKKFHHDPIFSENLVVLASAINDKVNDRMDIETYETLPHVSALPRNKQGSPLDIVLGEKKIKRNVLLKVPNFVSMPAIVASSDLICTIPQRLAKHFAGLYPLKIVDVPFHLDPITVYMIWHDGQIDNPAHRWLRSQLMLLAERL